MENYDLIIIGAGPAGLCLASELADSNLRILVLDKKKSAEDVHYNTAGSFINPEEWDLPNYMFNPINKICFNSNNNSVGKKVKGFVIDRKKLLIFLEERARGNKNIKIKYNTIVKDVVFSDKEIEHIAYKENNKSIKEASARIFVDCSGTGLVFANKLQINFKGVVNAVGIEFLVPLKKENNVADLFVGSKLKGGYGYIFPVNLKFAIVGYSTLAKECFSDVEHHLRNMWDIRRVNERCILDPVEKKVAILRTGSPLKKFTQKNILLIGDSAIQANPLVGEGIRFVMDSARIAAKNIKKSLENKDVKILENYNKEWRVKYYKKYKTAFFLQKRINKASSNDDRLDFGVRRFKKMSDKDFERILSGDLEKFFLIKVMIKSIFNK